MDAFVNNSIEPNITNTLERNKMTQYSKDVLKQMYSVSPEVVKEKAAIIMNVLTHGIKPVENPTAFVIVGQPGAGKTGIMKESCKQFDGNLIIYDIDEFREYHPKINEIRKLYPEYYVDLTSKFASDVSLEINKQLFGKKYNLGLHKTFKDEALIYDTLEPLRSLKYNLVLRIIATSDIESKMAALERSQKIRLTDKDGISRWVYTPYMNKVMAGMVDMCEKTEKEKLVDVVQVIMKNCEPKDLACVYERALSDKVPEHIYKSPEYLGKQEAGYRNVREAIDGARRIDAFKSLPTIEKRAKNAQDIADSYSEISGKSKEVEDDFIAEIKRLQKLYEEELQKTSAYGA